ncbi:MAG: hypothetical protein IJ729_06735 [Alloprevotella sp.]|nr:hypothetical protein [Alloprevotella sp.]
MKTYRYKFGDKELLLRLDAERGRMAEVLVDGKRPEVGGDEMAKYAAVISLALLEHDTAVMHDDETGIITLGRNKSRWANPAHSMNERGSLLKNLLGW